MKEDKDEIRSPTKIALELIQLVTGSKAFHSRIRKHNH